MATAPIAYPVNFGGINPTGANGGGGTTPTWGSNPPMGGTFGSGAPIYGGTFSGTSAGGSTGNYGYGSSGNPNPVYGGGYNFGGMPSMSPGGSGGSTYNSSGSPTSGGIGVNQEGWQNLSNELPGVTGTGIGDLASGFLSSEGGYNSALTQQAVQAQTQEMQLQANQNYGNLVSGLGEAGINPNSSAAQLGESNFWSQTSTAENAMTAQEYYNMWNQSMSNYTGILGELIGAGSTYKSNQPSSFDWASLGVGAAEGAMMI